MDATQENPFSFWLVFTQLEISPKSAVETDYCIWIWWTASFSSSRFSLWFLGSRVVSVPSPARLPAWWADSWQPTMQPVWEDHPCVHVSDVSYSVTHTMQLDCQPFVHKHNGFSRALSGSSFSQALLLISTSTYMERLGSSWVDSALCYGFETKSLDVLQILWTQCPSLIFPFSGIAVTSGVHPQQLLKNIIWILLTEQLLAVTQSGIILCSCGFLMLQLALFISDLFLAVCRFVRCTQFPNSLKRNADIRDVCCLYLNEC